MKFRSALSCEADYLSELSIRSKAYWGYSRGFMEACRGELSVTPMDVDANGQYYVVVEVDGKVVGFYLLEGLSGPDIVLGALFVDPEYIGLGIGKSLIERAKQHAIRLGARNICIQSDPNAAKFYRAAGGEFTGNTESESIPGRLLPSFRISLSEDHRR